MKHSRSGYSHGCRCDECTAHHRDYMREYQRKVYQAAVQRVCSGCAAPMQNSGHGQQMHKACRLRKARIHRAARKRIAKAALGTTGRSVWTQGKCARCRQVFCIKGTQAMCYCSERCKIRAVNARRKARVRNAFVADVSPTKVFEADGYRCHLCKRKVDRTKVVPHPSAPTIDHVIPIARGGTHEPTNCRTAHFKCNYIKSDDGGGEQFALAL